MDIEILPDSHISKLMVDTNKAKIAFDDVFRKQGCPIRGTQYDLLLMLHRHRKKYSYLTECAILLGVDRSTLSRRLDTLCEGGYVRKNPAHGTDKKRETTFSITDKGINLLNNFSECFLKANEDSKNPPNRTLRASPNQTKTFSS